MIAHCQLAAEPLQLKGITRSTYISHDPGPYEQAQHANRLMYAHTLLEQSELPHVTCLILKLGKAIGSKQAISSGRASGNE